MELLNEWKSFGGRQLRYSHDAKSTAGTMTFSLFLPPEVEKGAEKGNVPVLYWLSGLTCTDENFVTKACAQRAAAEYGVAIVAPDTSPRGEGVPDDPEGAYDFGLGAGFYVNATEAPWATHYQMENYVTQELWDLVASNFPVDTERAGIFGHSMGGHGALTLGLKNPDLYKSISAFAPICSPIRCPWGQKALGNYMGADQEAWKPYDATALVSQGSAKTPLFVDQGMSDDFLENQLKPELLEEACKSADHPLTLRRQAGYDHSYFFMASFMDDHIRYHKEQLG